MCHQVWEQCRRCGATWFHHNHHCRNQNGINCLTNSPNQTISAGDVCRNCREQIRRIEQADSRRYGDLWLKRSRVRQERNQGDPFAPRGRSYTLNELERWNQDHERREDHRREEEHRREEARRERQRYQQYANEYQSRQRFNELERDLYGPRGLPSRRSRSPIRNSRNRSRSGSRPRGTQQSSQTPHHRSLHRQRSSHRQRSRSGSGSRGATGSHGSGYRSNGYSYH